MSDTTYEDYGPPVPPDEYGPPVPPDDYGPPVPPDEYGPPVPPDEYGPPNPYTATPTPKAGGGFDWSKFAQSIGVKDKNGNYNIPGILAAIGGGLTLADGLTHKPQPLKSLAELRSGMPALNATQAFTPETQAMMSRPMQTGSALQRVYAADMQSPLTPGQTTRKYAEGGEVAPEMGQPMGALSQAFSGAVQGDDGGQSDLVDAKLSPGEYVLDAETVSALGDGNTAAGIAKLDELRQQLRQQKRGAPTGDIPPPAQGPLSYMGGQ